MQAAVCGVDRCVTRALKTAARETDLLGQTLELMAHVGFSQVVQGTDSIVKRGITTSISARFQCITFMPNYDKKSIEVGFINNQPFHLKIAGFFGNILLINEYFYK